MEKPEPPGPPPVLRRIAASDTTVEALGLIMKQNPHGILLGCDELSGLLLGFNQYKAHGRGADRQFYLSSWSVVPHTIDRKSSPEPLMLVRPVLSILGGIQPALLRDLGDERGRIDGLPHRFLFAFPDPIEDRWTTDSVDAGLETLWARTCERLLELAPASLSEDGVMVPVTLRLSPAAQTAWADWCTDHHKERCDENFPVELLGPWRKLEAYVARSAIVLHELAILRGDVASGTTDVSEAILVGACAFVEWQKSHQRRVYQHLGFDRSDHRVVLAVDWLRRHGGTASVRDVLRAGVAGVKRQTDAMALFRDLQDRELGSMNGKRPAQFSLWP
jgi:hypothetical protein